MKLKRFTRTHPFMASIFSILFGASLIGLTLYILCILITNQSNTEHESIDLKIAEIKYGDSQQKVRKLLGPPYKKSKNPLTKEIIWTYRECLGLFSSGWIYEIHFYKGKVKKINKYRY